MTIRPLLSHKRENRRAVRALKQTLQLYGAGGWKDTDDLGVGTRTLEEIRRAIRHETGGFIWWGTKRALTSETINQVEIPAAVERGNREPLYPIVPLFVDLRPGRDRSAIEESLGEYAEPFLQRNGLVPLRRESSAAFRRRIACRYVSDAIKSLETDRISVAFRTLSEPIDEHDLTFDWRAHIDADSRAFTEGAKELIVDALANALAAFQARESSPLLRVDSDLPLPLAVLVGFEWRITTRLRLELLQRTGSKFQWIVADGPTAEVPEPHCTNFDRAGPTVLVVSCGDGAVGASRRYADQLGAGELVQLHAPGLLDAEKLRGLARAGASQLAAAADLGRDKHLLVMGPTSLGFMIGAAANAVGQVTMPFWNGSRYVSPIAVGRV